MSWVDITTAIGTAAAAVVALGLGLRAEWRAFRAEQRERAAGHSAQASQVAGWTSSFHFEADPYPEINIRVRNGSEMPIYVVSLQVVAGVKGTFVRYVDAMGPSEIREFKIILPSTPRGNVLAPDLLFTDISGRRWLRSSNGELREIGEREIIWFKEDPGSFLEIEKHPTLNIPENRDKGKIVIEI